MNGEIRDAYAEPIEVPVPSSDDPFLLGTISEMVREGIERWGLGYFE